ncbi:bone marrow stromal antigen 2 [Tamandua tetradactyla]|uniref:bone marrow stromal antigen 2 n=1 Tax=Tamandua tetradactyla TaxID=48850 RepID=UPI0040547892
MAPTFYHHSPVPMADPWKELEPGGRKLPWLLGILLLLLAVGLTGPLIFFAVKANREACADVLQAERASRNSTHQLQRQLTWAWEDLQAAETRALTCNQTAVGLENSLALERAGGQQLQAQLEELRGEVADLTQKLQEASAEVERLRREQWAPGASAGNSGSPGPGPWMAATLLLLLLGLPALWT